MAFKLIIAAFASIVLVSYTMDINTVKKMDGTSPLQSTPKEAFMLNCGTCHHPTRDLTGPSIYGVRSRWKDRNLLYKYVRNSQEVIKTNAYAKALFIKWNKTVMTPFPKLTNKDIDVIFDYVDGEAKKKGLL